MRKISIAKKIALVLICLIIVAAYASVVIMSCMHDCSGHECTVCCVVQCLRNALDFLAVFVFLYAVLAVSEILGNAEICITKSREYTPVGLKVKLSD
jgi:hypothetical protein